MDIYIKPMKKAALELSSDILVSNVATVVTQPSNLAEKVNKLKIANMEGQKHYLVSITDIIEVIKKEYPDATINNVGEFDTWVHQSERRKKNMPLLWLKVGIVSLILMVGASTAIMSFHTDGQIPKVFEGFYAMFFGVEKSNPALISIPYSIGLAVGIFVFYNHFMGKKITDDLTPIEVEIEQYQKDVTESMIEMLDKQQRGQDGKHA